MEIHLINIEIPIDIFKFQYIYLIDNSEKYVYKNNIMHGLYAWTTDKELLEEFLNTRNKSIFTVKSKKISKKDLKDIKKEYSNHQLDWFTYSCKFKGEEKGIGVISTKNEYEVSKSSSEFIIDHFNDLEKRYFKYLNNKNRKSINEIMKNINDTSKVTKDTLDVLFYLFRFMFVGE